MTSCINENRINKLTLLFRFSSDSLHAVAGVRHGRALAPFRRLPQALAGDVGEDALRGDPHPGPCVGAARRGRRHADAAIPYCRVGGDGKRRPELHAATMLLPRSAGERGCSPLNPTLRASAPLRETISPHGGRDGARPSPDLESLNWHIHPCACRKTLLLYLRNGG